MPWLPSPGPLSLALKQEPGDRRRRGMPQTWRRFLHIVQTDSFFIHCDSPCKVIFRGPNLRKQTPLFRNITSQGQGRAVPLTGCGSTPNQRLLFLPAPRKVARSLLKLARPPIPGFLDSLSFSFIVCTSNRRPLKA